MSGASVDQCVLDYAFSLSLDVSGQSWALKIESDFDLRQPDGSTDHFGEAPPSAWGPAVDALLHATISDANVRGDGTLQVLFGTGCRVEVRPHPQWEAWQLSGPRGELIVCAPGGELSIWSAET